MWEDLILHRDIFVKKYLERIKINNEILPNLKTLMKIQTQHLLNIPFENLDIINNKKIEFDIEKLSEKILYNNRGGVCYELNGVLLYLLQYIGFNAKYIAAKVLEDGNEFDHVLILVSINSERWLVDVGFGDNFLSPIRLEENIVQKDLNGDYRIIKLEEDKYQLQRSMNGCEYSIEYTFSLKERELDEFRERCNYFETSNASRFRKNRMCSLERLNGRVSLSDNKLTITEDGKRVEKPVQNALEFQTYLREIFNINL